MTRLADARTVLTSDEDFTVPFDVSRRRIRFRREPGGTRPKKPTGHLSATSVANGRSRFLDELNAFDLPGGGGEVDTMDLLRRPVARSTTAALIPALAREQQDRISDLVLGWIDALAPVISSPRRPARWSRRSRDEHSAHRRLLRELAITGNSDPAATAAALAAGTQVPIAAGASMLTHLAWRPTLQRQAATNPLLRTGLVWETLRLYPPTWLIPRISLHETVVGAARVPAFTAVLVSPVALGQLEDLVPGPASGHASLGEFDPHRWMDESAKPGSWLPFGAGSHACPGRNLGLAQLSAVADWCANLDLAVDAEPTMSTTRGLYPVRSSIWAREHAAPA